jgi:hypothetical protein
MITHSLMGGGEAKRNEMNTALLISTVEKEQQLSTETAGTRQLYKRTIPTERPPLVGEVSANFCG